jgi:hypothetical protein
LYPNGTSDASIPGTDCRVYRGWPNSAALDADLTAGAIHVTIFPGGGTDRTTTRYPERWHGVPACPRLNGAVSGTSVTFTGNAEVGQVAGILVDGHSYAYRTRIGDTPSSVAANLATMIRNHSIVHLSNNSLTVAGGGMVLARVVADAPAQIELRRQEQAFRITCWCPTPAVRDTTASTIDLSLSSLRFISMRDGTKGRLLFVSSAAFDQSQNARLYRRDLTYSVEYPTTKSDTLPAMLFGDLALNTKHFAA